jgi:hypothetical protein
MTEGFKNMVQNDAPPDSLVFPSNDADVDSISFEPFEDKAGTELPLVKVSDASSTAYTDKEAAFSILISELEGCDLHVQSEFGALKEAIVSVADEHVPVKEVESRFDISSVQSFAVMGKRTMPSRDVAVEVLSSAEFMQPLVLSIIIATQCLVLAVRHCAVLSICHAGCDPPWPAAVAFCPSGC